MALGDIRLRYHRTCSSQAVSMTWKWRLCPSSAEYQTNPSRLKSWTPKMMSQRGRVAEPEKFGYTQRDASGPSRRMPPGLWDRMDGTFFKRMCVRVCFRIFWLFNLEQFPCYLLRKSFICMPASLLALASLAFGFWSLGFAWLLVFGSCGFCILYALLLKPCVVLQFA